MLMQIGGSSLYFELVGDHIFGLLPFLASRLNGAGGVAEGTEDPRGQALSLQSDVRIAP